MELIQKDADIISLEAEVKQGHAQVKKIEVEMAKHKIVREKERETQVRALRNERERNEDLKQKISMLSDRKKHKKEYDELRLDQDITYENNTQEVHKGFIIEFMPTNLGKFMR